MPLFSFSSACFCCGGLHTSTMWQADAATLHPVAEVVLVRSAPLNAQGIVTGFKVMTIKGVEALMTALTQQPPSSHHRSRQLFFQLYSDVTLQFWSNSYLDHEVLAVGFCTGVIRTESSGALTERCTSVSQMIHSF